MANAGGRYERRDGERVLVERTDHKQPETKTKKPEVADNAIQKKVYPGKN